jgi:AcrR family transcriptional regulator
VRYYFKTKESLLMAAFEKMNHEILELTKADHADGEQTYFFLKEKMRAVFAVMANFSFLFVESPKSIHQYPQVAQFYRQLMQDRKNLFLNVFNELVKEAFFKKSFSHEQQEKVFYSIFLLSDSWIRHHYLLTNQKPDKSAIEFYSDLVFNLLTPYLNEVSL